MYVTHVTVGFEGWHAHRVEYSSENVLVTDIDWRNWEKLFENFGERGLYL